MRKFYSDLILSQENNVIFIWVISYPVFKRKVFSLIFNPTSLNILGRKTGTRLAPQ